MRQRMSENMVWTNSQDYGSDEILFTSKNALFHKITRIANKIITLFRISPQLSPNYPKNGC